MLERGDLLALHEPLEGVVWFGATEVAGRAHESVESLLAWLLDHHGGDDDPGVFLKETTDRHVLEVVRDHHRFLAEAHHAFLIRRPEEIAESLIPLKPDLDVDDLGLEALHRLRAAVLVAGGHPPVVIDADDLVDRPEATLAAYCAAVGLPFRPEALTWAPGERPEWQRSARWHVDVSKTSGFVRLGRAHGATVGTSPALTRFAAHHRPFYEALRADRLDPPPR